MFLMHEIAGLLIPRLTCPGFLGAVESLSPVTHIFFNYLDSVNICIHIYLHLYAQMHVSIFGRGAAKKKYQRAPNTGEKSSNANE